MAIRADRVGVRQDQVDVHGRVTSPSFLNELLEDLPEWTDMPVWVNGTEELLPSNNSVPVTSPILADIAYPDIRRDNQYFTYRESPTPVDGLAKIKSIKGNTLKWNQLVKNGNFADTSNWSATSGVTFTVSNNVASVVNDTEGDNRYVQQTTPMIIGHKYLVSVDCKTSATGNGVFYIYFGGGNNNQFFYLDSSRGWQHYSTVVTCVSNQYNMVRMFNRMVGATNEYRNLMLIDLTELGVDSITDYASFVSLFPLPYYAYNAGSLLSFTGTGLKTNGKNLIVSRDSSITVNGISVVVNDDGTFNISGTATGTASISLIGNSTELNEIVKKGGTYTFTLINGEYDGTKLNISFVYNDGVNHFLVPERTSMTANIPSGSRFVACQLYVGNGVTVNTSLNLGIMLTIGDDVPQSYESYITQTTSLPITTYFPTGMKSAKNAYDELSPTKASVRIGSITFNGSEEWIKSATYTGNYYVRGALHDAKYPDPDAISNRLVLVYNTSQLSENDLCFMFDGEVSSLNVNIKNTSMTTLDQFKAWLQANPVTIYYELATPVELPTMSFE